MERKSPKRHMVKIPMAKSPVSMSHMPKSPMPKSPMPKSPLPKSPVAYEKYKSKCAYGLINLFRFRHRRSKKMISDADNTSLTRHALDDRRSKIRVDWHLDQFPQGGVDENTMMVDSGDIRVNKIKKDVSSEQQQQQKKISTAKVENVKHDSEHVPYPSRKNNRKAAKTSRRSHRLPIYGCHDISTVGHTDPTRQNLAERPLKSLDSIECNNSMQCDDLNAINVQVNLNEATEAFINQKLIDGRHLSSDDASLQSKHFLDALEVLNSNKDLFVKLLQDPNSLLVKHIEDLRDSQEKEQPKLPKETGNSQPLENIVVLKPCLKSLQQLEDNKGPDSPQFHSSLRNVQQSIKPAIFPFKRMKRKFMQAMRMTRKEQLLQTDGAVHLKSTHGIEGFKESVKETGLEIISRNSPDKASPDFGGLTASSTEVNESGLGFRDEASSGSEKDLKSSGLPAEKLDLHVEPKMDTSDLKYRNMNILRKQRAKTWDGVTSVPDYDFLPTISSGRTKENGFLSPQRRLPHYISHQIVRKNHLKNQEENKHSRFSPLRQNLEALPWAVNGKHYETRPNISDGHYFHVQERKVSSSLNIDSSETETNSECSFSPTGVTSKSDSSPFIAVNQSTKTTDTSEEDGGSLASSRMDLPVENPRSISSPDDCSSSPSSHQSSKEFHINKDNSEQPSPISVLDQCFTEDVNSPLNTESKPTTTSVRQLQIDAEEACLATLQPPLDHNINSCDSTEEYRSMFNYISAVLQACHFTWDRLSWKCCFSDQIVDQSSFEVIDVWPSQCCGDRKLLFDYVNEVVLDAYWHYLRRSPWLSFIKPRILPPATLSTGSIIHEVMNYVDWNLLLAQPSETLEKIIEMDLNKSGRWMDIQIDAEEAVSEIVDSLLEEITTEIALQ